MTSTLNVTRIRMKLESFRLIKKCLLKNLFFVIEGRIFLYEAFDYDLAIEADGRALKALHKHKVDALNSQMILEPLTVIFCRVINICLIIFKHEFCILTLISFFFRFYSITKT